MSENALEQTLFQQEHARPVSGEDLEVFGKKASSMYLSGQHDSLNDAVVEVVKHAQLSPEQVRRVVEFTNQSAYLAEFEKQGSHKIVNFAGGPANPSVVLKDLNDGGGGSVFDTGMLDYSMSPKVAMKVAAPRYAEAKIFPGTEHMHSSRMREMLEGLPSKIYSPEFLDDDEKTASAAPAAEPVFDPLEDALWAQFGGEPKMAYAEPMRPLEDCYHKLASMASQLSSDIDALEIDYRLSCDQLYERVKEASLAGDSLGDVLQCWSTVTPDVVFVKAAFEFLTPRLHRSGVFRTLTDIDMSMHKVGSAQRLVNPESPVVLAFTYYCDTLSKLAGIRDLKTEVDTGVAHVTDLMKEAWGKKESAGGLVGKAWRGLGTAGDVVGEGAGQAGKVLFGLDPKTTKKVVSKGVQYGGAGLAGLGANAAVQEVTDRPAAQSVTRGVKSVVPGTEEYNMRRYRNMSGGF